jgi:hypothetical protein
MTISPKGRLAATGPAAAGLLAALLTLAGCSSDRNAGELLTRADSAGIEVVSIRFLDALPERWSAGQRSMLDIGEESGPEDQLLHDVTSAALLEGNRVVLANAGSLELRIYDQQSALDRRIGREGDGPGEFRYPRFVMVLAQDSVLAFDRNHHRLTLFGPAGEFAESWTTRVTDAPPIHDVAGHLTTGEVLLRGFIGDDPDPVGPYLASEVIGTFDRARERFRAIDTISGSEMAQVERDGRLVPAIRPFGRKSDLVTNGRWVFALDAADPAAIRVYAPDQGLVRIIRVDAPLVPVSAALAEAWIASFFEAVDFPYEQVADMWRYGFANVALPDSIPLFRSLAPDSGGGVCAERYGPLETTPPEYWCFSPDGDPRRVVRIPQGLNRSGFPHQDAQVSIGQDHVLGVWADELGVERVRVYLLEPEG